MTYPTDPEDGELRVEGPNVLRWQDGTWLLQEPLGLPARPNLVQLRNDWVGRWVLIAHPDGRPVDQGFVERFAIVNGDVMVVLDDGPVLLDRHSTIAHDPVGRAWAMKERWEAATIQAKLWAAEVLRSRAVVLRDRDEDLAAHELEGCAQKLDGSGVHVTATTFRGA